MDKPNKPTPDFPLTAHRNGRWRKKIRGKDHYFGRWDDPYGALAEYQAHLDGSKGAAVQPRRAAGTHLTLADAVNDYLAAADVRVAQGTMKRRTWNEQRDVASRLLQRMGRDRPADSLTPTDFASLLSWFVRGRGWQRSMVDGQVQRTRTIVRWIYATHYPGTMPAFGPDFRRRSRRQQKQDRAAAPTRLIDAAGLRAILAESSVNMRAMVLLGINAALGGEDCCRLTVTETMHAVETGWLLGHRVKTSEVRQARLWSVTRDALRAAALHRAGDGPEFFRRTDGRPCWSADRTSDYVQHRWRSARSAAGVQRGGFYDLRHTANTIGRGAKDIEAVRLMMGHVDPSIGATYTHAIGERAIDDARIIAVSDRIAAWLALPG